MIEQFYDLKPEVLALDRQTLDLCREQFAHVEGIRDYNQLKMLRAFTDSGVAAQHFFGSTGYGVWDDSRNKLEEVFCRCVGAEAALVRPQFMSGTHTLTVALFGLLRTGDTLLAATGRPYDTLEGVIGIGEAGKGCGTLREYGIRYDEVPLNEDFTPDYAGIAAKAKTATVVHIQRSRGYGIRRTLSPGEIGELTRLVKSVNPDIVVMVDNSYGEFVCETEPLAHGADLMAASLIKNPGGGLAPCGGYIAGRADLVERAAARMTLPGIGGECGASLGVNRALYQGFFLAPHTTAQALKTAAFCAAVMEELGYRVSPAPDEERYDIIQTIDFGRPEPLIRFCKGIQSASPVDSFASPEPGDMPGYESQVIMAAGAFIQGASIELSCDAPLREPYTCYLQGGLTYESGKLGILRAAARMMEEER